MVEISCIDWLKNEYKLMLPKHRSEFVFALSASCRDLKKFVVSNPLLCKIIIFIVLVTRATYFGIISGTFGYTRAIVWLKAEQSDINLSMDLRVVSFHPAKSDTCSHLLHGVLIRDTIDTKKVLPNCVNEGSLKVTVAVCSALSWNVSSGIWFPRSRESCLDASVLAVPFKYSCVLCTLCQQIVSIYFTLLGQKLA